MRRKRVVIDIDSIVPMYVRGWCSGIGHATLQLVRALEKTAQQESLPFDLMLYSQNTKGTGVRDLNSTLPGRHLYYPYRKSWNRWLATTPVREWATSYDLWHCPHNFDYVSQPRKTIITLHDAMFAQQHDTYVYSQETINQHKTLSRQCKGIITCSRFSKQEIVRLMEVDEGKVFITPWGCDTDRFQFKEKKQHYFLATSCSMFRKNTLSVIYAYKLFLQDHPDTDYQLRIVWSCPPREILLLCREELSAGKIEILQHQSDEEMAVLYQNARVTLFPSLAEGFGLPILESMASGTPVITCRNTSLEEVGGDKALYVNPYDIRDMKDKMWQLAQDNDRYHHLQHDGRKHAESFSWEECARQTLDIYRRLLQ